MKLCFLLIIILHAVIVQPVFPQQTQEPLSKNQVMTLVKAGMETPELVKLIHEHGIDFDLSDDYLQALGKAGAQEPVIQALHAARPKPLTQEQALQLVVGHVPSERAAALVRQHGIDFLPDEEYLKTLRLAGADETLIAVVREAGQALTGEMLVTTSPNAEVFLDGESQGHSNPQGELALKAKLGAHALKVTLAGKKDYQQIVTLAALQATRIEARLADAPPAPGAVRENPKDGLKYVWIPPGTFVMGCSPGDNECDNNEKPAHQVTITRGFWIGQTPVTVGAYKRFVGATGQHMPVAPNFNSGWVNDSQPVVGVNWIEANAYCTWAGGRLPTEAEWEYAARGGSTEARYGNLNEIAWYWDNSGLQAHDVALKRANGFGLFDVLGNVWEWVNDWHDPNYYQNSPSQDPPGPTSSQHRVLRSGSWASYTKSLRLSDRNTGEPGARLSLNGYVTLGVRCDGELFAP